MSQWFGEHTCIKVRIKDAHGVRTYYALYKAEKDDEQGYAVHVYTEKEYNNFRESRGVFSLSGAAKVLDDSIEKARRDGRSRLYEFEIYELLRSLGINVPQYVIVKDPKDIPQLPTAKKLALKIISSSLHKSDEKTADGMIKGVEIVSPEGAEQTIQKMFEIPGATGVLVCPFVENASGPSELLIGFADADLGRLICFGQGGTYTDYRPDRAYRDYRLPFSAKELISSTDVGKHFIYGSYRSKRLPLKAVELESIIEKLAAFKAYYDEKGEFNVSDLEINPLMCLPDGRLFACDAKLNFTEKKPAAKVRPFARLRKLLHPKSIAIIGAVSDKAVKSVGPAIPRLTDNVLRTFKDKGTIYLHFSPEYWRNKFYAGEPFVTAVPDDCDLCIVLKPCKDGVKIASERMEKGSAVVLIGAGFDEVKGDKAAQLVQNLRSGIENAHPDGSLVGPNTMGIITPDVDALFSDTSAGVTASKDSNIAFISQSGAFLGAAVSSLALRNTSIHYGFSIGNAMDLGAADYLEYIIENEPQIKVVAMYLESSGSDRLGALIRKAREKGISVIIRKGGTTEEGAKSTVSHTASSAGKFEHFKAVLEQAGAAVFSDTGNYDLWVDTVYAASHFAAKGFPDGNKVFAISSGGEDAVSMTDTQAVDRKLNFPQPGGALAGFISDLNILNTVKNPFDITAGTSVENIKKILDYLDSSNDEADLLLFAYLRWLPGPGKDAELIQYIKERKGTKPLVMILKDDSDTARAVKKELREAGVLVFDTPQRAVLALGAVLQSAPAGSVTLSVTVAQAVSIAQPVAGIPSETPVSAMQAAMKLVPVEFLEGWLNLAALAQVLQQAQCEKNIITEDDKSTMIFSEKATFGEYKDGKYEEGLGIILPSLIKSRIRVAVVATTDKQRTLIDELNKGKPQDQQIICKSSISEIVADPKASAARYYYFKVSFEPDAGGDIISISIIVEKILEAIGRVTQIADGRLILQMHEAARQFAMAA
ncbi:MAG: acetate--CoA ligase family protein [Candidatus Omnitrophota bacterium]|nr:acetate--CoA ligase family protein [Candidatus Omnitrophota bacterium]